MKKSYSDILEDVEKFYDKVGPKFELIYPNFTFLDIYQARLFAGVE